MNNNYAENQQVLNAIRTPWINFHNYNAAFHAIQKIKNPTTHRYFKAVLVKIALTGKAYDISTQEYI